MSHLFFIVRRSSAFQRYLHMEGLESKAVMAAHYADSSDDEEFGLYDDD